MPKLILMQGLPASGKSTRAAEIAKLDGNAVRLNKDLLREMLHFNVFTGKKEGMTQDAEQLLAERFLEDGHNVIIDDTNLNPKVRGLWKAMASLKGYKFEIVKLTTTVTECINRDKIREKNGGRFVGQYVIKNMARQYRMFHNDKKDVLVDLDGTLADIKHRLHHVHKTPKDWKGFFDGIPGDSMRLDVYEQVREYKDHNIVFVSARPEDYQKETLLWLNEHFGEFDTLIMRRAGDSREDSLIKKEILDRYFDKENIEVVFDDRPRVIRMWQEQGLKVVDVGQGIEF